MLLSVPLICWQQSQSEPSTYYHNSKNDQHSEECEEIKKNILCDLSDFSTLNDSPSRPSIEVHKYYLNRFI